MPKGTAVVAAFSLLAASAAALVAQAAETPLARLELGAKRVGWDGIEIGMSLVQVERRSGQAISIEPTGKPGCRAATVDLERNTLHLTLDLNGVKPGAKVERIFVHFEGYQVAAKREDLVAELRRLAPAAVYLPPADDPGMAEADDPRPAYSLPGAADSVLRLLPRFGLVLASRGCLGS